MRMFLPRAFARVLLLAVLLMTPALPAHADDLPDVDELWDYRDPAASEKRFRELLPKAEASGRLGYRLELLTQVARALGLQGKFDAAHEVLDGVEKLLTGETKRARVRFLLERGRTFNSSMKPAQAVPLFEQGWALARKIRAHGLAVDAAHMLGIAAPGTEEKLAWNVKAMEYAEGSQDPRAMRWLGTLYNNIGWTYHAAGRYEKALEIHTKGWLWRQERAPDSRGTRVAKWSVAKQLRALGRARLALAMQRELLAAYEKLEQPSGFVYEEIGECLLLLGSPERAKPWFARAWPLLKDQKWIQDSEPERLPRIKRLAGISEGD